MTIEARGHVVALAPSAWGHAKSHCALLPKLVRQRPIHATLFIGSDASEKAEKEIDHQFLPGAEDHLRKRVRVFALEISPIPFDHTILNDGFIKEYKRLLDNKNASIDDEPNDESGPPQLVILDQMLYTSLQRIRAVSGQTIPVYVCVSSTTAGLLSMFGPGGIQARLSEDIRAIPCTDQEAFAEEVANIYYKKTEGKLIKVPGIPLMYDHELLPQKAIIPDQIPLLCNEVQKTLAEVDGAVINSTSLYEGPAIKAFQEWFDKRSTVSFGPFDYPVIKWPKASGHNTDEVEEFMESMLEKYGQNSVVYISIGSYFWPYEPEKLWAILDVLIEQKVPFIFAHASPFAVIPDKIKEKIKSSGLGYQSNWLPQTTILSHEACGWILTHAGHNSIMEALSAGKPMICWPFDCDQPIAAANIAFVHNVGYELFEVRVEKGLLPIHRLGDWTPEGTVEAVKREFLKTIELMKGDDGAVKRANAQKFREGLAKLWAPDGENWQEMKKITDHLQ